MYPVYTCFLDWELPRLPDLPRPLRELRLDFHTFMPFGNDDQVRFRDRSCRVSNTYDGTEWAHLVPKGEGAWWAREVAPVVRISLAGPENAVLLRKDLHFLLDQKTWTPMVKAGELVVHVTDATGRGVSLQFQSMWHNRRMQETRGVDKRLILARIAWTVFPLLSNFLYARAQAAGPTRVKVHGGGVKDWSPKQCAQAFDVRARSRSPRRKQSQMDGEAADQGARSAWSEDSTITLISAASSPGTTDRSLVAEDLTGSSGSSTREHAVTFSNGKRRCYSADAEGTLISPASTPSASPPRGRKRLRQPQDLRSRESRKGVSKPKG